MRSLFRIFLFLSFEMMRNMGSILSVFVMVMHCTIAIPPAGSIVDPMIVGPEALSKGGVAGVGANMFGDVGGVGSILNPAELEAYGSQRGGCCCQPNFGSTGGEVRSTHISIDPITFCSLIITNPIPTALYVVSYGCRLYGYEKT